MTLEKELPTSLWLCNFLVVYWSKHINMRYKDLLLQKIEQLEIMLNNLNLLIRQGENTQEHFDAIKEQMEEVRYQVSLENED